MTMTYYNYDNHVCCMKDIEPYHPSYATSLHSSASSACSRNPYNPVHYAANSAPRNISTGDIIAI